MSMDVLQQLFATFKVRSHIFHNGQYCGNWAIDTSGASYICFHVVTHGECYFQLDNSEVKPVKLQKGDMLLLPRDRQHCLSNDKQFQTSTNRAESQGYEEGELAGSTGLVCGYFKHNHPLITQLTAYLPDYVLSTYDADGNNALSGIVTILLNESRAATEGSDIILNKLAECILVLLFRQYLPRDKGVVAAALNPKLNAVISAIHTTPSDKWTVDKLADLAHLSRAAFSELFKEILGVPPMEYVTKWRLTNAYRMLADEKRAILDVAQECGYDNESSFSKAFKRVIGVSPGQVKSQ